MKSFKEYRTKSIIVTIIITAIVILGILYGFKVLPEGGTFSFETLGVYISCAVSILMFYLSWISRKEAKASEEKAMEYAKNADEHNQAAKEYYDYMNDILDEQKKNKPKDELKEKAYRNVCMYRGMISTEKVALTLQIENEHAEQILLELWKVDRRIKPHVTYKDNDYKTGRWIKNKG